MEAVPCALRGLAYNARMKKQAFGRTGFDVSVLGFGSAPVGYLKTDQDRAGQVMNQLLDAGVNLIDTAASYPGSEELIARTIGHRRDQFVLVSKCGSNKVEGVAGESWTEPLILGHVDRSLRNLKTDRLDVMLLHSCDLATLKKGEAIGALVKARLAGKIRFAGYSGDNEAAAWAAAHPEIAVIETSINIADQVNIDQVLPAAREHKVGVLAKRPIANAAWKDITQQPGMYQSYAKTYTDRLRQMGLKAEGLGADWPEIALRFCISQEGVHSAIIGTTNPENARKNIEYANKGPLPADVVKKIRDAFNKAESAAGEKWTGQT
jgi:aryl-alcohol dehydrogenase-like predicted oxidoreductase